MKIFNTIKFFLLLLAIVMLSTFALADTECANTDCSIDVSINVTEEPSGAFAGSVRDLTGGLIANANVTVLGTNYSTVTATGNYTITEIPPGRYSLIALADGYLSQTKTNQLAVIGITTNVYFELSLVGLIKGNVLDFFTGNGINNANVTLSLFGEDISSALTNVNGYYEFTNLAPGYYDITLNAVGFTSNSKPDNQVLGGRNTTVNLWLW